VIVARRFARDRSRSTSGWALGMVGVVLIMVMFWPSIRGNTDFDTLIKDLPEAMKALIGAQAGISLGTPAGYLNARLLATTLPILLLVFGVGLGAAAIAGAEEAGTLELLLINPVSRRRVAAERALVLVVLLAGLAVVAVVALVAIGSPVGLLDGLVAGRVVAAFAAVLLLGLFHAALAFALGAATGRRGLSVAAASAVAVAGYLVEGLLAAAGGFDAIRAMSPWHVVLAGNLLANGVPVVNALVFAVLSFALLLGGVEVFSRRDLR
jgi:ABC-2 type transport system permease protein